MPYTPKKFERAIDLSWIELRRASGQFIESLARFPWLDLLRAILFLDEDALGRYANLLLDIVQTYVLRVQLLPARVAAFMAAESASFPKKLSNRVLRADTALSFALKEVIDEGFELAAGKFVPIYDVFKSLDRVFLRFRVFAFLDGVAVLRLAKAAIIGIIIAVIKILWAILVTIATLAIVFSLSHKWNQDSQQESIASNFLADDSVRLRRWPRGRIQFRVNARPGPDRDLTTEPPPERIRRQKTTQI